jgi:hypothetical protein
MRRRYLAMLAKWGKVAAMSKSELKEAVVSYEKAKASVRALVE